MLAHSLAFLHMADSSTFSPFVEYMLKQPQVVEGFCAYFLQFLIDLERNIILFNPAQNEVIPRLISLYFYICFTTADC